MKYFFVSDLHGVDYRELKFSLEKKQFNLQEDTLCVAGDITHGGHNDDKLIKYLKHIQKHGKLLAVQGNHDIWTYNKDYTNYGKGAHITHKHVKWIQELPFIVETDKFIMTHGIYVTPEMINFKRNNLNKVCVHGSPCLIGSNSSLWSGVSNGVVKRINETWDSIEEYEQALPKELFVGHFHNTAGIMKLLVKSIRADQGLFKKIKVDKENNLVSYGKIHFVASDLEASELETWINKFVKPNQVEKFRKSAKYEKMKESMSRIKVLVKEW